MHSDAPTDILKTVHFASVDTCHPIGQSFLLPLVVLLNAYQMYNLHVNRLKVG